MPVWFPSHSRQLPLTPPEYYDPYAYSSKSQPHTMHPSFERYQQANPYYANDARWQPEYHSRNDAYSSARHFTNAYPRDHSFVPVAPQVLPPIREQLPPIRSLENQHGMTSQHYKRDAPAQAAKQEKTSGGVAAELDYDMEVMVDFVAQMTSGMWAPFVNRLDLSDVDMGRAIQPATVNVDKKFRQYVQSVLTSTRLPSATLLLALHYLSDRIKRRSGRGDFPHRFSNNLYHHLTVALMLASKFLDDNTFQNRSWAEVSQLPVSELNAREMDWLHDIHWHLHVDWEDADGVSVWFARWDEYNMALKMSASSDLGFDALKLSSIDNRGFVSPAPISPPTRDLYDQQHSHEHVRLPAPADIQWPQIRSLSPPSAGPTHESTPEFYHSVNSTPCYMPPQHSFAQTPVYPDYSGRQMMERDGQLVYTRRSPTYGPGFVCQTRQRGNYTYDTHAFVGLDYTKRYASQLELGWCELHHQNNCFSCGQHRGLYGQAQVA